jgi:hypothetical protein
MESFVLNCNVFKRNCNVCRTGRHPRASGGCQDTISSLSNPIPNHLTYKIVNLDLWYHVQVTVFVYCGLNTHFKYNSIKGKFCLLLSYFYTQRIVKLITSYFFIVKFINFVYIIKPNVMISIYFNIYIYVKY